jgi:hypothetical protein
VGTHTPATQTLYAQLFEAVAAVEVDLLGGFANGLPIRRTVRNGEYLYWQMRTVDAKLRQIYLGLASDPSAQALVRALEHYKETRRPLLEDLERLTAAYVASGGSSHFRQHFRIVDALARAGIFRTGAVLVGSHAFVSIGASLGVSWTADTAATADVDISRDAFVSVACDDVQHRESVSVPGVLSKVDPSFFLVPELDLRAPSASLASRRAGVRVDFLTTPKTPRDVKLREIPSFGIAARPLRYMDFLIRTEVERALFIGPHAVLVNVPAAGRFALHKLAVSIRRSGGDVAIKSEKDRRQAAALIRALADTRPGALAAAVKAAKAHHDKGLMKDIRAALARLPEDTRAALRL